MVNPFLSSTHYDTETAIMLERAYVTDIGRAVAYTDGDRIFLNTQDNLFKILPAYNDDMLKWLLWHERMHLELKHHNRFFRYLDELSAEDTEDKFQVTKDEVNIIMDILVHDWMSSKFPELVETAVNNLAQFRDRNSLKYTFKTNTLEEMLDEYRKFKHKDDEDKGEGEGDGEEKDSEEKKEDEDSKSKGKSKGKTKDKEEDELKDDGDTKEKDKKKPSTDKAHAEGGHDSTPREKTGKDTSEVEETPDEPEPESEQEADPGHHDETDWSKLEDLDSKEFITESEGNRWVEEINALKNAKIRLARITKTLNGLVTDTKVRSYKTPSYMQTGQHTIFKGSKKGHASLYLCFDASGSMGGDMDTFKEIIGKAIPQAMKTPTTWFSGWAYKDEGRAVMKRCVDPEGRSDDYYKGTFADFMNIMADSGYSDDGDRTIELCWKAEQAGYSPIGITDGGGCLSWSTDMLKQLKRTVFVGHSKRWLLAVQKVNPNIQIIYTGRESD
ncbi:MAG: hypothetical protein II393_03040 [Cytophagales bacterium]|nr:hypothetical protein [Cytophagales bacterium]